MHLSAFRVPSTLEEVYYIPEFINKEEEKHLRRKISDTSNVKWKTLPNRRCPAGATENPTIADEYQKVTGGELTPSNVLIPQELPKFITDYPDIIPRLRETGAFSSSKHGQPNHVIVNEYQPGQGIMPHEDGPSYHPVVATLSLGSHAVFNYHRYLPAYDQSETFSTSCTKSSSVGRVIDPTPVLSLLLEPRSLIITTKALYTCHLHGIEPVEHDLLAPGQADNQSGGNGRSAGIRVANRDMLEGERERRAAQEGGVLERGTRISLTCRDVERVVGGKIFM